MKSLLTKCLLVILVCYPVALYAQEKPVAKDTTNTSAINTTQAAKPVADEKKDWEPILKDAPDIKESMPSPNNTLDNNPSNEKTVYMRFEKASIDQVLDYVAKVSGLTVVKDTDLSGDITILTDKNVSLEDAITVLNSALAVKGFTAIQTGKVLKVVALENAKTSEVPVIVGSDPKKISPSDEFITYVMPLSFADAAELKKDLSTLISKRGDMSANSRTNTIIITESASIVKRLAEIINSMDQPQVSSTQVQVFMLKNADATDLKTALNDIFKQDSSSSSTQTGGGFFRRFMPPGMPGGNESDNAQISQTDLQQSKIRTAVKFSVDERTNSIIVSAPSSDMEVISQLIKELDKDATVQESVLIVHLKHGNAASLASMITKLLQSSSSSGQTSSSSRSSNNRNNQFSPFTMAASSAGTGSISGEVNVQADTTTNSLVFLASPRYFDRLKEMVAELDYARPQVMVEVVIAERTINDDSQLGAEWSILTTTGKLFGNVLTSALTTGFNLSDTITQGFKYSITNQNIQAVIQALKTNTKLNILSTPRILTSDNSSATIKVGEKVPFLTSRQVTDTGSVYNSYDYQDVGIDLTVTPHINPDGYVSMSVNPSISKIEEVTYYDAPVIANREATTEVMVKDGETVIIGGLMKDDLTESVSKVPLAGDIPLVGKLFQYKSSKKEKTELLVFLTPKVVRNAEDFKNLSAPDKERLDNVIMQKNKKSK